MKTTLLATAFGVLLSSTVFAAQAEHCDLQSDRCSGKPLTVPQQTKTLWLADKINGQLEEMAEAEKAQGRDLKVVVLARMGSSLDKFRVLDDNGGKLNTQQLIQAIKDKADQDRNIQLQKDLKRTRDKYEQDTLIDEANRWAGTFDRADLKSFVDKNDSLKYSHLAIAFRNFSLKPSEMLDSKAKAAGKTIKPEDDIAQTGPGTGKWAVYHLLYSCEDQKISHIFKATMHEFFRDHLSGYTAQIIVPTQEVQNNLEDILLKKRRVYRYQTNQYNAVAKIDDLSQQNSNQFVVEAIAAAMRPDGEIMSRQQAVDLLNNTGFSASKIIPVGWARALTVPLIGGIARKALSSMMPTVCLKNQPDLKKYDIAEIITSNSVVNWMKRNNIVQKIFEIALDANETKLIDESNKEEQKEKDGNRT